MGDPTSGPGGFEVSGYEAERRRLAAQCDKNEAELNRLADLPTGAADPAARERQLDKAQDEIEGLLGEIYLRDRGEQIESDI